MLYRVHLHLHTHLPLSGVAIPRLVSEDDTHEGYYIPKGTMVIPNSWYDI